MVPRTSGRTFTGEVWYPGSDEWRVTARFERYDPPKQNQFRIRIEAGAKHSAHKRP
jgi:uncharacterized protein (DUF1684 family)